MTDPTPRARLEQWKQGLVESTSALVELDEATGVALPDVDPVRLLFALASGSTFTIDPDGGAGAPAYESGRLRAPLAADELQRRLVGLRRTERAARIDRGVTTLYLGLGTLTWKRAGRTCTAPLWLLRVELERSEGGGLWLVAPRVEPRFNQALGEALRREHDLVVDPALDLAALLETLDSASVTREGWHVGRGVVLANLPVAELAIARDLDTVDISRGAVARLLSGGRTSLVSRDATEILAPLDADCSQLAAIAAAAAGDSLVVQAPPGTGATQTIANLLVHCAAKGLSVLVVSDRLAALDAIVRRLASVGLDEIVAPLHAAEQVDIVAQLARVLERPFRPMAGPSGAAGHGALAVADARLAELRAALDDYATAMHAVGPFGRSMHAVLARLVELRTTPNADLAEGDAPGLDRATYERRVAAIGQLATAALPVEPVATHPWRRSTLTSCGTAGRDRAATSLGAAVDAASELMAALAAVRALVPGIIALTPAQLASLGTFAALAAMSPRPGAELVSQVRAARGDEVNEAIALIRARGTGSVEVPRDPASFVAIASRHRALRREVAESFTDAVEGLDAAAVWSQLRRWTGRVAPLRYVALRGPRAELVGATLPGALETDEAAITALEAVLAERACRAALQAAAEAAKRWFGELAGDPLSLDLDKVDAAVAWASELRRAFDQVTIAFGDSGRQTAWRALVAQVSANPPAPKARPSAPALLGGDKAGERGDKSAPTATPTNELAPFARLAAAVQRWQPAVEELAAATGIARAELGAGDDHLATLREQLDTLGAAVDTLPDWARFHAARAEAAKAGIERAIAAIERGDLGAEDLAPAWERATLLLWADAEHASTPALAEFHGVTHHAHVAAFADLDRGALALARARALVKIAERVPKVPRWTPPGRSGSELAGDIDPVVAEGIALLAEARAVAAPPPPAFWSGPTVSAAAGAAGAEGARDLSTPEARSPRPGNASGGAAGATRGVVSGALRGGSGRVSAGDVTAVTRMPRRPLRDVLASMPHLLTRLAPAVLATPSAIAAYLDPALRFDIVVIDEASQLTTAHALGALGRGATAVIIGDSRSLAPAHGPGVLADALAAGLPELHLAWQHRVRHDELFAPVAARFYDNRVHVLPAPHGSSDLGITWREGDAAAVAADVVARLRDPAQCSRSLAVVALSREHAAAIDDLLEAARAADPSLDRAFEARLDDPNDELTEPVVVRHVDDAAGLERDVIVLYADSTAPATDRRLAVALTRAREQLVIVSADEAHPIARELAALRASRDGGPASAVMEAIARALVDRRWVVKHSVGSGPFRIDLAVVDPSDPERFVLAIEGDGIAYATATGARDRDRLRPQMLAALGWRLHRMWTLDWWIDPEREIHRAHGAITAAIAAGRQRRALVKPRAGRGSGMSAPVTAMGTAPIARSAAATSGATPAPSDKPIMWAKRPTKPAIQRGSEALAAGSGPNAALTADATPELVDHAPTTPVKLARNAIAIGPYTAAAIPAGRRAPDDMFAPRHLPELGKVIEQVLAAEAPIHIELLARRVGAYFGIGRVTQRVTDQVRVALAGRGRWGDETGIVWRLDQDPTAVPAVRVAGSGPEARRDIDEVPLSELAAAARIVVERASSGERDRAVGTSDLVRDAARLLGFPRLTDRVVDRIARGVRLADMRELISIDDGKAKLRD